MVVAIGRLSDVQEWTVEAPATSVHDRDRRILSLADSNVSAYQPEQTVSLISDYHLLKKAALYNHKHAYWWFELPKCSKNH